MSRLQVSAVGFALALVGIVQCGGGSAPTAPTSPARPAPGAPQTVSADLPDAPNPSAPGLYQDGKGTYPPGDEVYVGGRTGESLFVRPVCPGSTQTAPRELNLVLAPAARAVASGRLSTCVDLSQGGRAEAIYLHVPNPLAQQPGAVAGAGGAPPNADTSVSVFLFLNLDSNGDGTIRVPPDDQYNVRWQKGIYLKQRSETATTTIYELTSLETSFGPDLSCSAELILRNTPLGEISKGFHCLPLVVTITLQK